ncbi:hypothetical protein T492DRAFT_1128869 [Pavlovales sp. CCMP2436]|nr:hypothetical protein T492DRAFT_1128869 [Pavlovales sp. CCMP2436]
MGATRASRGPHLRARTRAAAAGQLRELKPYSATRLALTLKTSVRTPAPIRCDDTADLPTNSLPAPPTHLPAGQCVHYTQKAQSTVRDVPTTPKACAKWCAAVHSPDLAVEGQWCCEWVPTRSGGKCAWTDGSAAYVSWCRGSSPAKPLAFEACSLAAGFLPLHSHDGCRRSYGSIAEFLAVSVNACSQRCKATPKCTVFGFKAKAYPASLLWGACQLFDTCAGQFPGELGYVFFVKGELEPLPALTVISRRGRSKAANAQPMRSPVTLRGWPTQVGLPLGQVIDPSLPPDEASAPEKCNPSLAQAHVSLGDPCDTEGETVMQIDGD